MIPNGPPGDKWNDHAEIPQQQIVDVIANMRATTLSHYGLNSWTEVLEFTKRGVVPTIMDDIYYHMFVEIFAVFAHEQWSGWTKYEHSKCTLNADGTMTIPKQLVDRWSRQSLTSYDDLSPQEQESDRVEARKMVELAIKLIYSVL